MLLVVVVVGRVHGQGGFSGSFTTDAAGDVAMVPTDCPCLTCPDRCRGDCGDPTAPECRSLKCLSGYGTCYDSVPMMDVIIPTEPLISSSSSDDDDYGATSRLDSSSGYCYTQHGSKKESGQCINAHVYANACCPTSDFTATVEKSGCGNSEFRHEGYKPITCGNGAPGFRNSCINPGVICRTCTSWIDIKCCLK
mmetsp:Transcript_10979/g.18598  ORF Transcript_10979/g.18598 Transcript_10979/m.18598 type:complete len:195 (-) Transcript_10979:120-704(-)